MTKVKEPCKSCIYYNRGILSGNMKTRYAYCISKHIQIKNIPKDCDRRSNKSES